MRIHLWCNKRFQSALEFLTAARDELILAWLRRVMLPPGTTRFRMVDTLSNVLDVDLIQELLERRIWVYVRHQVCAQDSEDVFQDICLHVYRGLPGLKNHNNPLPWLFAVARNRIQDHIRKKASRPEIDVFEEGTSSLVREHDGETRLHIQKLRACIDNLNAPYREPAVLHFVAGLTVAEVVDVLSLKFNTVKSLIKRCRPLIYRCVRGI